MNDDTFTFETTSIQHINRSWINLFKYEMTATYLAKFCGDTSQVNQRPNVYENQAYYLEA